MKKDSSKAANQQYWIDQCAEVVGRQMDNPYKAFWAVQEHLECLAARQTAELMARLMPQRVLARG